jgi:hypothetical protein
MVVGELCQGTLRRARRGSVYGAGVGRSGRSDVASDPRSWSLGGDSKKFEGVAHKS